MEFLFNLLGGSVLDGIFKTIVQPFLQAWMKAKDVDLEKHKQASQNTTDLATAVLDANVKFAETKSSYALAVLHWWPFRVILFVILVFAATRFCLAMFDSTYWWIFGCQIKGKLVMGDACSWSFPAMKGNYGEAEFEYILFFVIAKPVDTAVSGALGLVSRYLARK